MSEEHLVPKKIKLPDDWNVPYREHKELWAKHQRALSYLRKDGERSMERFRRFRPLMGGFNAAKLALKMLEEDRQAGRLPGPLVLVEGKVRYRPYPGEKTFPGDLVEYSLVTKAA